MQSITVGNAVLAGTVILVVLIAGCLSGIGEPQPQTTTTPAQPIEAASETPCVSSLAYYSIVGSASATSPDKVLIGFRIDGGASVIFVASENETILGTSFTSAEYGSVADGHSITFDEQLDGTHTVRVSAYEDTDRNQEFDRGTDRPCYSDGERVQTTKHAFNFSSDPE